MILKNKREIYQALVEGKKIISKSFSKKYIYLNDYGLLCDSEGVELNLGFDPINEWSIYQEPKKKKVLKEYLIKEKNEPAFCRWFSDEDELENYYKQKLQALETGRTAEIDDE